MPTPLPTNPRLRITSWVLFGLCGLALLPWLPLAVMSPMMFDSSGSTHNLSVLIVFFSLISYPLFVLAGLLTGWLVKNNVGAVLRFALPLLDIVIGLLAISTWSSK